LAQVGDHHVIGHPVGVLDFVLAADSLVLIRHGLAELLAVRGLAVCAVAVALGVLHALVGAVEIHYVERVVHQDLPHQSLDDVADRRVQAAFVIFRESVVLGGHGPAAGKLLVPVGETRVLGSGVHEGVVERHVGHILHAGLAAEIHSLPHDVSLQLRMYRVAGLGGEVSVVGRRRVAYGIGVQLARDFHGFFGVVIDLGIKGWIVGLRNQDALAANPVVGGAGRGRGRLGAT